MGYQKHPPIPTVSEKTPLEKYDMLLLCSDGFWGPLNKETMADTLTQNSLAEAVERMAYQAEFRSYPEADNISVITLRWVSNEVDEEQTTAEEEHDELTDTLDALNNAMGKLNP